MNDINGREYALFSTVKVGDQLVADGGFTCIKKNSVLTVYADEDGDLCVPCRCKGHALDGQLDDENGTHLIGLYPA